MTQKALCHELDISWATISKFFNGKPVDRRVFIEICHQLGFEWSDIAELPSIEPDPQLPKSPDVPPIGATVVPSAIGRAAQAARVALTPRILERISRSVVRDKYLPAIERGVQGVQRVIPIVAPAGYGKSTILGEIYDRLTASDVPWVALVLCNSLVFDSNPNPDSLAIALGTAVSGTQTSILHLTEELSLQGRGVLLLDTLDLVINRPFVAAFGTILQQLLERGTTIVFTCRDHEYNDFLEPTRTKLAAVSDAIDRYNVPEFTIEEVKEAALAFVGKQGTVPSPAGITFADRILALSADNRPLQDIICNPLLLALLCDLFAKDGNVPPDLTVSKLYQRYWQEKVAYSRADDSHSSLLAIEKESFCLAFAKALFQMSAEKLCESAYKDELAISFTPIVAAAYDDLLSEGVIERLLSTKIHFFHQTLLEYAIAYWLTRHNASAYRQQLLATIGSGDSNQTYWFPVIRQLLTIVDELEFEAIAKQLDLNHLPAFRAIAFAATSRSEALALERLLPTAIALGSAHQKILHRALASASVSLQQTAWDSLLMLLREGERDVASSAAQSLDAMLNSWGSTVAVRLEEAIDAIDRRIGASNSDRAQLYGWLIDAASSILTASADNEALQVLSRHYLKFSEGTRVKIIALHLMPGVTEVAQQELFHILKSEPLPKKLDQQIKQQLVNLLAVVLPGEIPESALPKVEAWLHVLHHPIQTGFDLVQAKAVGRLGANDDELLRAIVTDLIAGDKRHTNSNLMALYEAISCGASDQIAAVLIDIDSLPTERYKSAQALLSEMSSTLELNSRATVADWIRPMATDSPELWISTLAALGAGSSVVQQLVVQLISPLPLEKQATLVTCNLLRLVPALEQHLLHDSSDSQLNLALIGFYRETGKTDESAISKLIRLATKPYRKTASAASDALLSLAQTQKLPSLKALFSLARSMFDGVRLNYLSAIKAQKQWGMTLEEGELTKIAVTFERETEPQVIQRLCELIADWVDTNKYISLDVAQVIGCIPERLHSQNLLEGGVAGSVIDTFNVMALLEDSRLLPLLEEWTRQLLHQIDIKRVQDSKVVDLLGALGRVDGQFLQTLVDQDCLAFPSRNIRAVALAIRRVEGEASSLLDSMLAGDWCPGEVKSLILEWRRA